MNASTTSSGKQSFFQVWVNALSKPSENTYAALSTSPGAKANTAFLWIFLCSFAPTLVSLLVSGTQLMSMFEQGGMDTSAYGGGIGAVLVSVVCVTPFLAVFSVLGFMISVALMQWIARMFGGQGTFDQLAYSLGSIAAPAMLVSAVLTLPSIIPVIGICSGILSLGFGLYLIVLQAMAIKGVNKFGWGAAIGTLLIPGLVVSLLICCVVAALVAVLGPAMGGVFSTINQSLGL